MTDKISGLSINGIQTGGNLRELKSSEIKNPRETLNDGKDQIYVEAGNKKYVIEGEDLNFSGLKKGNGIPNVKINFENEEVNAKIIHTDNEENSISDKIENHFNPPPGWGNSFSQVQGLIDELADLKGNKDLLWDNEDEKAGTVNNISYRNPIALKTFKNTEGSFNTEEKILGLKQFRAAQEEKWGSNVTNLDISQLKDGEHFAVQKAITISRMERTPADVTEGFVKAVGSVNGEKISDREIFWQRFKPVGEPSGKVILMVPGFLQTGRNFYEQISLLNKKGHDVIVMDQQWAGQTKGGKEGGVDRGYGIARDVAVMAGFANKTMEQDYSKHNNKELIIMGTSLGGGPGTLGALTMNENNLINIEGDQMPKNVKAVLQAPFMGSTKSILNKVTSAGSHLPLANQIPLPAIGIPVLSVDDKANQKLSQTAVLDDAKARLQAMTATIEDNNAVLKMIEEGKGPKNQIFIVHAKGDPLADSGKSKWLDEKLTNVTANIFESGNHVFEQDLEEQGLAIEALEKIIK